MSRDKTTNVMKKHFLLVSQLFIATFCFSQDIIVKSNGDEIKTKIIEVNQLEIKYKNFDYISGPSFSLLKSDVFMVRYENGTKDVFNDVKSKNNGNASNMSNEDMAIKGREDATSYYKGEKSGAGWTAAATIITSPILGAIPAFACSSSEPLEENLLYKDSKLMKNANYKEAYVAQAHKIKKRKIWTNFGIASGVWLGIVIIAGGL
jgi:hypothetical protein